MNSLRIRVIFLVLIAMLSISVISVSAHITYLAIQESNEAHVVYRKTPTIIGDLKNGERPHLPIIPDEYHEDGAIIPGWLVIDVYVALILVCAGFVSIVIGNMIAKPLFIIDQAIDMVDPKEVIPLMRESGSLENKETIRLLNRLSEKIKKAMESRMRLVAAAGHDLRTPLQRMRLRVEFLDDDTLRKTWLKDIDEMTNIANSAITLVKEEVSADEKVVIHLGDLMREVVGDLQVIGHKVRMEREFECDVIGGYMSLKRAFTNIIVNAATHGHGARVFMKIEGKNAIVHVVDHGPGIPEDMLDQAFEPFFRSDRARKKVTSGAGLGLAIVKEIITRHKGTITLANRKPHGLRQTVSLPLYQG